MLIGSTHHYRHLSGEKWIGLEVRAAPSCSYLPNENRACPHPPALAFTSKQIRHEFLANFFSLAVFRLTDLGHRQAQHDRQDSVSARVPYLETFEERTRSWINYVRHVHVTLRVYGLASDCEFLRVEVHVTEKGILEVRDKLTSEVGSPGPCGRFGMCIISELAREVNEGTGSRPGHTPIVSLFKALAEENGRLRETCESCGSQICGIILD